MRPFWTGLRSEAAGRITSRATTGKPPRGLVEGPTPPSGSQQPKQVKKSAHALTTSVPTINDEVVTNIRAGARVAGRWALSTGSVVAGLVGLLYVTSFFESLMHSHSGMLTGTSPIVATVTGLAVGTLHTVAGPDHLAGLAPLVVGQRRSFAAAFGLGALWGSGHATGQLLIGLACLLVHVGLLKAAWAPALGEFIGLLVGLSLVAIGCLGLHEAHEYEEQDQEAPRERSRFGWATYATGVLHGLSPDALIFVAPALALPRLAAALHVTGVVAGTLLSMGGCTACLSALCRRNPRIKSISTGASSVAILLGFCILAAHFGLTVPLPGL